MNYSIYENRLVPKYLYKYVCCSQAPPEYFWISENFLDGSVLGGRQKSGPLPKRDVSDVCGPNQIGKFE